MPFWHQPPEHCNHVLRRNAPASFVACSEFSHSSHGAPGEMKLSSRHGGAMPKSRLNTEMTKFSADRAAGDNGPDAIDERRMGRRGQGKPAHPVGGPASPVPNGPSEPAHRRPTMDGRKMGPYER